MLVEINVTALEIVDGEKCDANNCPHALAINKVLSEYICMITKSGFKIWNHKEGTKLVHVGNIPEKVSFWVTSYDLDNNVQPISYYLDIPEEFLNETARNCLS